MFAVEVFLNRGRNEQHLSGKGPSAVDGTVEGRVKTLDARLLKTRVYSGGQMNIIGVTGAE